MAAVLGLVDFLTEGPEEGKEGEEEGGQAQAHEEEPHREGNLGPLAVVDASHPEEEGDDEEDDGPRGGGVVPAERTALDGRREQEERSGHAVPRCEAVPFLILPFRARSDPRPHGPLPLGAPGELAPGAARNPLILIQGP